jgi:hypothetical protein
VSRVQLETRRHYRAAALWALTGGVLLGGGGLAIAADKPNLASHLLGAGGHALAFGMLGGVWLATILRFLSSQLSRASVRPPLLTVVLILWNGAAVAGAATLLVGRPVRERGLLPLPLVGSAAAIGIALLIVPVVVRRLSPVPPAAYHHLAALGCLGAGLVMADIAYLTNTDRFEGAGRVLVLGGWAPLAGAVLFFTAFDYEAYEDKRWPLLSLIAIGVATVARFLFYASPGSLSADGINLFTSIAGFGLLIAFATVLRTRWHGGMSYWFERFAFTAVVALAVCVLLGVERPLGSPIGPPATMSVVTPSFLACILMWAAAVAVMLVQRDIPTRTARLVMWPIVIGGLAYPVLARISENVANSASAGRLLAGGGLAAAGVGFVVLALHLLSRPRLRAVR